MSEEAVLYIPNAEVFYRKLPEINFLRSLYKSISFDYEEGTIPHLCGIYPSVQRRTGRETVEIDLDSFSIGKNERKLFRFPPVRYLANGLLGDFFHELSVVHETFQTTGRKGIVFLSEHGTFRFGAARAYQDTLRLVISQDYIEEYLLYGNDDYDVDLTRWALSPQIFIENWHTIFRNLYGVPWGTTPWIKVQKDPVWKDTILVHSSIKRPIYVREVCENHDIYMYKLPKPRPTMSERCPDFYTKMVFISQEDTEYAAFCQDNQLEIPHYRPSSLEEMAIAISSCRLFIGSMSAPLAMAYSLHAPCITKDPHSMDTPHFWSLMTIWDHFTMVW